MSSSSNGGKKPAPGGRGGPTIRTLADINRGPSGFPGGEGGGSDSDEPQEYYTGGEKSGMLVQDPTRRNDVDSIFEQARQMGAVQGVPPFIDGQSSSSRSFTGTGRLLSGEPAPSAAPQPPVEVLHNIHLWNNGFSVDDGPLRDYDNPENADFIESIKNSQCPQELEPADRRTAVHVNVIKRLEDYKEPIRARSAFQGVGRTLGGGSSAYESSAPAPPAQAPPADSRSVGIIVDDSQPFTSIQLRLADGTRMVARFNMRHTVGDIRSFIDASRPGAARPYLLQTGFPPKQLTDPTQTVEQAGLANSVIMQKI
ncbi:plant UBX domain-containing protein 4-like [Phragmites australis]|uniref:plant UBX domain-containing protein 4-like n=1 Tax=Phragmites australis TaxID=29695 RepID=UPI002D7775E4|nr:plant UBX domain-containing protein 4-like [Phragmites australis]